MFTFVITVISLSLQHGAHRKRILMCLGRIITNRKKTCSGDTLTQPWNWLWIFFLTFLYLDTVWCYLWCTTIRNGGFQNRLNIISCKNGLLRLTFSLSRHFESYAHWNSLTSMFVGLKWAIKTLFGYCFQNQFCKTFFIYSFCWRMIF